MQDDPYNLRRFVDAQREVYARVCAELRAGRKTTHWMWFIFPQIRGLGHSSMAQRFAIASLDEACAYLAHPTLGPRLIECTELVLGVQGRSIEQILGDVDAMKFRSSMTLFARAATEPSVFTEALNRLFGGEPDALTLSRL
jgi:uncharacterized protein (DUF1810 family)